MSVVLFVKMRSTTIIKTKDIKKFKSKQCLPCNAFPCHHAYVNDALQWSPSSFFVRNVLQWEPIWVQSMFHHKTLPNKKNEWPSKVICVKLIGIMQRCYAVSIFITCILFISATCQGHLPFFVSLPPKMRKAIPELPGPSVMRAIPQVRSSSSISFL